MVRFEAPRLVGVVPRAGRTIERVESHGKHLEIEWDDGIILHTHMRMSGTWHVYRRDDSWQRPHREMRALIEVPDWMAVCFNAPVVETYRAPDVRRHPGLGGLGPDLCRPDADLRRCIDALLAYDDPQASVAEVLLDQRVFCGVGNVYRCEVLWVCEMSPFARVSAARRSRRRTARPRRRQAAAGQPAERRADHRARSARRTRGVRTHRATLPTLHAEHRDAPGGQPRPGALLVPRVPGAARSPELERPGRHADGPPSGGGKVPRGASLAARRRQLNHRARTSGRDSSRSSIWAGPVSTAGKNPAQIARWHDSRPDGGHSVEIASRTFMLEALYDG